MMTRRILLSPDLRRGRGIGHLTRCLDVARRRTGTYTLHIPDPPTAGHRGIADLERVAGIEDVRLERRRCPWEDYDMVVFDRQRADRTDLSYSTPSVGIDLGGPARRYADYVIDTFPTPPEMSRPNRLEPGIHAKPQWGRSAPPTEVKRVLLTFGGEDPADLTTVLAVALTAYAPTWTITAVRGPANRRVLPADITVIDAPPDLRERLADYDLVITSYGLTAFEALAAGCAVVTFNPTRYHERLARAVGLPSIGVQQPRIRRLFRLVASPEALTAVALSARSSGVAQVLHAADTTLDRVLDELKITGPARSPVTGEGENQVVERFTDRTYHRCRETGLIFQRRFNGSEMDYGHDYFFADYAAHYGRSYVEDFDHIRSMAAPRLGRIRRLTSSGRLLDVGCAFGPFLDAARAAGFDAHGIDVSTEAVSYVTNTLTIPATAADFMGVDRSQLGGDEPFDVLTMWYVIEHFEDLAGLLKKTNRLMRLGGTFAFATPNVAGISGRRSMRAFLERSPIDHFTVWSPQSAGSVLRHFGFAVASIRVTGHHPERFGVPFQQPGSLAYRAAGLASRLFGLGDTFEVYARKTREINLG